MALPSGAATCIAPTADPAVVAGIIAGLSDEQKNAVLASEPHIRIVAAAGAGKTETITRRIVYLLARGAPPQSIVAFTFTEKAAAQMKERIYRRVQDILGLSAAAGLGRMFVGTIHAYCFRLLQDHYGLGNVDVLDQNQEVAFISRYVHPLGIAGPGQMQRMGRLLRTAAVYCDELLELSDVEACDPEVAARLGKYSAYLSRHRLITFGQLVRKAVEEVGRDPQGIGDLEHLVVDEFQDINPAQERLIHLIAGRASCCVVGDPRQCIYQWRGSDPGCFERFSELLPGVRDYAITANRRSVPLPPMLVPPGSPATARSGRAAAARCTNSLTVLWDRPRLRATCRMLRPQAYRSRRASLILRTDSLLLAIVAATVPSAF